MRKESYGIGPCRSDFVNVVIVNLRFAINNNDAENLSCADNYFLFAKFKFIFEDEFLSVIPTMYFCCLNLCSFGFNLFIENAKWRQIIKTFIQKSEQGGGY